MTTLEEKLGYTFQSPELLENALTHSSCANESMWEQFILHRVTLILSRLKVRRST